MKKVVPPTRNYPITTKIPEEALAAIGQIATQWAALEYRISFHLFTLTKIGMKYGRMLGPTMSPAAKISMISSVLEVEKIDIGEFDFLSLKKEIEDIAKERNEWIHGIWIRLEDGSVSRQITKLPGNTTNWKPLIYPVSRPYDAQSASDLIKRIIDVNIKLDEMQRKIFAEQTKTVIEIEATGTIASTARSGLQPLVSTAVAVMDSDSAKKPRGK